MGADRFSRKRRGEFLFFLSALSAVFFGSVAFAGIGVTRRQLDKAVDGINSNMSQMVSAEIGRNVDGYVDEITLRAIAGATNFLPSFIEGLGQFAEASRFSLLEFDEKSLVFDDSYMSNGVFVSRTHKAYFTASWVSPTNKGFTVASSSYPGIPAGTLFAIDETPVESAESPMRVENSTGMPTDGSRHVWRRYRIYCADILLKPLELLWCESRYDSGAVDVDRRIAEQGLYRAVLSEDGSTPYQKVYRQDVVRSEGTTSPGWKAPPAGESHIVTLADIDGVFRMAVVEDLGTDGRILGTFTLVPTCLSDAQAHAARHGTEKLSAASRLWRFVKGLFVPDALAARHPEIFSADTGLPLFRIVWTTEGGEELGVTEIPVSRQPPKKRVNDKGEEHDTDEIYVPCPWYTLADWRTVENWISFPTQYTIYYADAGGKHETENGTKFGTSTRQMNVATFKALFLGHVESLESLYVYPRRVEKKDPCKEGRHSYVHCVCSVCGNQREHEFIKYGDCYRCGREECIFTVDENNEIVEEPGSRSACGFVPDGEENHGGWHGVGEIVNTAGSFRFCGCSCGHYSDSNTQYFPLGYEGARAGSGLVHLTLDHDFPTDVADADWVAGDENGDSEDTVHNATLYCRRDCGSLQKVVESHVFYREDGSYNCYVRGMGEDNYHEVVGVCLKCSQETETADLHRRQMPDEGSGATPCVCIGGVQFDTEGCGETHHKFEYTACGEIRCLYCLAYSEESPRLSAGEHSGVQPVCSAGDRIIMAHEEIPIGGGDARMGVVLRSRLPNDQGHWCGCGLVQLNHNKVKDPDTGETKCPDGYPLGFEGYWWAALGCGHVLSDPEDGTGDYEVKVTVTETRGGGEGGERNGRTYRISSFSWNPDLGEFAPLPSDLWGDDPDAPTSLPPLDGGDESMEEEGLAPTVVDFTYLTEIPSEWSVDWEWDDGKWKKKGSSFWDSLKWWLQNTPIIFTFR